MGLSISDLARRLSAKKKDGTIPPERVEGIYMQEGSVHPDPRKLAKNLPAEEILDEMTEPRRSRSGSGNTAFIP